MGKLIKRDLAVVGRGIQPIHVRQTNQRAVLSVISLQPGISNAELARVTQLAPQTVSAVLADLEQAGLITRGEVLRGRRGQPATPVFVNPRGAFCIGAEIGWNHIEVTLVGIGTQVLARYRRDYDYPDASAVFDELRTATADMVAALPKAERHLLIGMGLAAPGGIGDPAALLPPPPGQAALWSGIELDEAAAAATGLDVALFNDGSAACWAERVALPLPRPMNFVFLLIDTFVGAGIVAENRLWEGFTGESASLGSMLVTGRDGQSRFVHEIASLHALRGQLEAAGCPLSAVYEAEPPDAARRVLEQWLADASFALAQTLINTARVIEFELAVIEAVLPAPVTARLIEATRQHMSRFRTLRSVSPPVVAGQLGRAGTAEGAALLRMHRRFFSRELAHMDA